MRNAVAVRAELAKDKTAVAVGENLGHGLEEKRAAVVGPMVGFARLRV